MNNSIKKVFLLLLILSFKSCIEPITIDEDINENLLIVQATITDELKTQTVKLSRTFSLKTDNEDQIKETNATVSVSDESTTYDFTETSVGIYKSNIPFKAEGNKEYTLTIKTVNGETYNSRPEKINGYSEIINITPKKENNNLNEEGIMLYVEGKGLGNESNFFKYEYEETFKIIAPYWSNQKIEIVSDIYPFEVKLVPDTANNKICYTTKNSTEIIQNQTATLSENVLNFGLKFIKKEDFSISHRYSVLVKQHVQSLEAYNYYNTLNKLASNESIFTQSQPGFLLGNIISTSDSKKKVVGYFEVNSVTTKRIFFNRSDFFELNDPANFINPCVLEPTELVSCGFGVIESCWSPLIGKLKSNIYSFYTLTGGKYIMVPKSCGDCTETGTNIKPSFWID